MNEVVLLDARPLGMISHPGITHEIATWLVRLVSVGVEVLIPEIADYEVSRELLRVRSTKGIERLNELRTTLGFVPITSVAMLQAATFWADARRRGRPTASDESLDADVILAGSRRPCLASRSLWLRPTHVISLDSCPQNIGKTSPDDNRRSRWSSYVTSPG